MKRGIVNSIPLVIGMKDDGKLDFLDIITLLGFIISVENLNENMNQNDKQDIQNDLSEKADKILTEIHSHLEAQDEKINKIWEKLNEKN